MHSCSVDLYFINLSFMFYQIQGFFLEDKGEFMPKNINIIFIILGGMLYVVANNIQIQTNVHQS